MNLGAGASGAGDPETVLQGKQSAGLSLPVHSSPPLQCDHLVLLGSVLGVKRPLWFLSKSPEHTC